MKRRRFIGLALLVIIVVACLGWFFRTRIRKASAVALEPRSLAGICSREQLLELGNRYREISGEDSRDSLINRILQDYKGPPKKQADYLALSVEKDFKENRTVVVDGWLLSITEARQCALLSLE